MGPGIRSRRTVRHRPRRAAGRCAGRGRKGGRLAVAGGRRRDPGRWNIFPRGLCRHGLGRGAPAAGLRPRRLLRRRLAGAAFARRGSVAGPGGLAVRLRRRGIGGHGVFLRARGKAEDKGCEAVLLHRCAGIGRGKPAAFALVLFRPVLKLAVHRHGIDQHHARHGAAVGHALVVAVAAEQGLVGGADQAGFLIGFLLGGTARRAALHRPAFGDDPAARLTRGDEIDADRPVCLVAERQHTDLLARLALVLFGLRHRERPALSLRIPPDRTGPAGAKPRPLVRPRLRPCPFAPGRRCLLPPGRPDPAAALRHSIPKTWPDHP